MSKPIQTEAWVLKRPDPKAPPEFTQQSFSFTDISPDEVLTEPLFGCWEGNMEHAIAGSPIDLCAVRNEPQIVLGNSGVVRVARIGGAVDGLVPGDVCMVFCAGDLDPFGYPSTIMGFDCPGSMGVLAQQAKFKRHQLIKLPQNSQHSAQQWAAFSLRFVTAWSNWVSATKAWRIQMDAQFPQQCHVIGWGGGVAFAQLELAQKHGCRATLITSSDVTAARANAAGIGALRRDHAGANGMDLLQQIMTATDGAGADIFIDNIGADFRTTLRGLARQGVVTTCGWRESMVFPVPRAATCIARQTHIFTHYAPYHHGTDAMAYGETAGWMPAVSAQTTGWDDIGALANAYAAGEITDYFPTFSINT